MLAVIKKQRLPIALRNKRLKQVLLSLTLEETSLKLVGT
ncbi:hypothetical protein Bresa_02164|uniref:Uncharacterized protein n=1 Tax=Brenneria salicis ATCC 15712 = DSM 30166 TaxID=714314 RepID=A0A366I4F6_9GAMM|nr:hypothetical protein [Brenneria salicis ATCC 15712 = DSM 30166]RBP62848.1 hypothetical protein DES54_11427 [Brenneria salicis ATCC 15712 = DSM 30166]